MLQGSLLAYVNFISAWSGAMDPELRLPVKPQSQHLDQTETRVKTLKKSLKMLKWLQAVQEFDQKIAYTLSYLRACIEIQRFHLDVAIDILKPLCDLDTPFQLLHYKVDVRQLSALRLAQAYDIMGYRDLAKDAYQRLVNKGAIREITRQAEIGLSAPFRLPDLTHEFLLREYVINSPLYKYRVTSLQLNQVSALNIWSSH